MPYFFASLVKHPNLHVGEAYALEAKSPIGTATITVFISDEFQKVIVSTQMANLLGVQYSLLDRIWDLVRLRFESLKGLVQTKVTNRP